MYRNTSTPADDNGCGWFHLSPARTPRPAHSGRSQARWAVLGAGFTGLAAARQLALKFPHDEIVLIEGQRIYAKLSEHLKPSVAAKLAADLSGAPRKSLYGGNEGS